MKITCLRTTVQSGTDHFPLFIGFCRADELSAASEAPSFPATAPNEQLAKAVRHPPVYDWQRPISDERVASIIHFCGQAGALMPNPVLLAASPTGPGISAAHVSVSHPVYEISIPDPPYTRGLPLWILDGQHRIRGMAGSAQQANDIPIVLLLDDPPGPVPIYNGSKFAGLFAQVTTTAENLDAVHRDWLSYTYDLGPYSSGSANHDQYLHSMEATVELCARGTIPGTSSQTNPWHDKICFNPHLKLSGQQKYPFYFDCPDIREVIRKMYFAAVPVGVQALDPLEVATELMRARAALESGLPSRLQSVFFGPHGTAQRPMQDGFVDAVLTKLVRDGAGVDWTRLLKTLRFNQTDWDFQWANTSGTPGTESKNVARRALTKAFLDDALPAGTSDLSEYLQGKGASLSLLTEPTSPAGNRLRKGAANPPLTVGGGATSSTVASSELNIIRIDDAWKSRGNIAHVDVRWSGSGSRKVDRSMLLGRGVFLGDIGRKGKATLTFSARHYGDRRSDPLGVVELTW